MLTRDLLVDQASCIVRKAGYAGFSYADLSKVVGFTKATIHYYFPNKRDLAVAMVKSHRQTLTGELQQIWKHASSGGDRLALYANLYRTAVEQGDGCLCGVLAAEFPALPAKLQQEVHGFFDDNTAWLEAVLLNGSFRSLSLTEVRGRAQMIIATLQGALLITRATKDTNSFDAIASKLIESAATFIGAHQ